MKPHLVAERHGHFGEQGIFGGADEGLMEVAAPFGEPVRILYAGSAVVIGLTTIFATHNRDGALCVADRIVVMAAGRVEQVGTPREIYQRPTTRFVAEFIGLTNMFTGGLEAPGSFRTQAGERFAVSPACSEPGASVLAIRPEHVRLKRTAAMTGTEDSLEATVEDAVFRGALTKLIVRTASGTDWRHTCRMPIPATTTSCGRGTAWWHPGQPTRPCCFEPAPRLPGEAWRPKPSPPCTIAPGGAARTAARS
ncbi:TOBE domain-containing protein [Xanthobacter autotrophicus]|uniref:TOBE domain-containing protein n=1 Tax=Xanthobacter autotrophicus TaxID=280 RepID=UPI003727CECF